MSTPRHTDSELLRAYLAGTLAEEHAVAVDEHLMVCVPCRAGLPADPGWREGSWDSIADTVLRPRRTLLERGLERLGLPAYQARLLAATPSLSRAWLSGLAAVLLCVVALTHVAGTGVAAGLPFLLVAPLLPLAGVAFAYGPGVDPAHELLAATPFAGPRLLLLRSSAVLVAAVVPTALATPLLPSGPLSGAAWLLPALTLCTACLALSIRIAIPLSAGVLATAWGVTVAAGSLSGDHTRVFQLSAQLAYAAIAAVLTAVVYLRRHHFDSGEPPWTLRFLSAP